MRARTTGMEAKMSTQKRAGRISRRNFVKSVAVITGAAALPSMPFNAAQAQPVRGGTLRYGLSAEPRRMNQLNTTWMTDATQHLYDRLVTRSPDGKYVPHLAEWSVSDDQLTWTFRLKPN